ncbi:MAG: hypothetical protein HY362_02665 [Candidatus Aenigmarchaeota archaeon]|nr:hypothetical protein [Candidatus Aenigmarchaeota archaeon]
MKGIESMPIRILASVFILFAVVSVGLWQLGWFTNFKTEAEFKQNTVEFSQKIQTLKAVGTGSFDSETVHVPDGWTFTVDLAENTVYARPKGGANFTVNVTANLVKFKALDPSTGNMKIYTDATKDSSVEFSKGTYNIRLYYGQLDDDKVKDWTLVFGG